MLVDSDFSVLTDPLRDLWWFPFGGYGGWRGATKESLEEPPAIASRSRERNGGCKISFRFPDSGESICFEFVRVPLTGEGESIYWAPMVGGADRGLSSLSALTKLVNNVLAEGVELLPFLAIACFALRRESPLWGRVCICVLTGEDCAVEEFLAPFSVLIES